MDNVKLNLTVILQGRVPLSEQECSKQLKKPIIIKKGKFAGKQLKDKQGRRVYKVETVEDLSKYNVYTCKVGKGETITYYTKKCRPVKQVINMTEEAYKYFIGFESPLNFKDSPSTWKGMSKKQKLDWHMNNIASSLGGVVDSYVVFDD